jgi:hypothetical protein
MTAAAWIGLAVMTAGWIAIAYGLCGMALVAWRMLRR